MNRINGAIATQSMAQQANTLVYIAYNCSFGLMWLEANDRADR